MFNDKVKLKYLWLLSTVNWETQTGSAVQTVNQRISCLAKIFVRPWAELEFLSVTRPPSRGALFSTCFWPDR